VGFFYKNPCFFGSGHPWLVLQTYKLCTTD